MISGEWFYWLVGITYLLMAGCMFRDRTNPRRRATVAFWGLLGACYLYGTWVASKSAPSEPLGIAVLVLVILGGFGLTGRGARRAPADDEQEARAARWGNRLFLPMLVTPATTFLCTFVLAHWTVAGSPLLEPGSATLLGVGIGGLLAVGVGMRVLRERRVRVPLEAGAGLLQALGWTLLLPQLLAVLGSIFEKAGVGRQMGAIVEGIIPKGQPLAAVALYCVGMAVLTALMGNAFAVLPILTTAIGWPVLVLHMHGNPAAVLMLGMLAGYCGTLCTPMAANFNLVPASLLEIRDRYGPIKAQAPTAVAMLACDILILYFFAF
ncbi:DUF979 domain-containing protein [Kitasatospora sp. NPDC059088]|uniref:DUF979 domain-containing protein n=1 Tax=Kitasatospora sp. NPDC059088 TaxID=3346722 RepID=UPI003697C24D